MVNAAASKTVYVGSIPTRCTNYKEKFMKEFFA